MAVLKKEEFFDRINKRLNGDTSEEAITFLEDMTDTYSDMENRLSNSDADEWKRKYEENDAAWKKRYAHRFFSGGDSGNYESPTGEDDKPEITPENIQVADLFEEKEM